jgi:Bax protein
MQESRKVFKIITQLGCLIGLLTSANSQAQSWRPDWNYSYYRPYPYQNRVAPMYNPYTGYIQPYPGTPNYYFPYPYQNPARQQQPVRTETKKLQKTKKTNPDIQVLKAKFVQQILPIIQQENRRLIKLRYRILNTFILLNRGYQLKPQDKDWLISLAKKYKVKGDPLTEIKSRVEILKKVDIIPVSLALAQAANESAWGQSRFSIEANNLFGIWTFNKKNGLKPKERDEGKKHLVRKFEHIDESIQYYMLTLNRHAAYRKMRNIRQQLRNSELPITGDAMAKGLEKYSEKGTEYVELIQNLIRQNDWDQLDRNV